MKLALIPPRGMENDCMRNVVHLALAQNDWKDYNLAYRCAADRGDFIIVDNGAAENAIVTDKELIDAASRLCATEVVVPDIMRDCSATLERHAAFFKGLADHQHLNMYTYMGVVQGKTLDELMLCAGGFAKNHRIRTLGIPRHLIKTMGNSMARIDVAIELHKRFGTRFSIHLLGTDRSHLKEVYYVGKYHSWIRSVDTSTPYIYAAAQRLLPFDATAAIPTMNRPENYFLGSYNISDYPVKHNVEVMNAWCRGDRG